MKITYLIYSLMLLMCIESAAQNNQENQNNTKQFYLKLSGGYSTTLEDSKLLIVGGDFDLKNSPTIGGSLGWYYNKNWSLALATSTGKYDLSMVNGQYSNMEMYRYDMELGSVWITPIQLSANYHITSILKKVIPYVSVGGSYVLFHNVDPGWGADEVSYSNILGVNFGLGVDYNINSNWFMNISTLALITDRSNMKLDFKKSFEWEIASQIQPHQFNFNLGLGYRF